VEVWHVNERVISCDVELKSFLLHVM